MARQQLRPVLGTPAGTETRFHPSGIDVTTRDPTRLAPSSTNKTTISVIVQGSSREREDSHIIDINNYQIIRLYLQLRIKFLRSNEIIHE